MTKNPINNQPQRIQISRFTQIIVFVFLLAASFGGVVFPVLYKTTRLSFFLYGGAMKDICLFIMICVYVLCLSILLSKNAFVFLKQTYTLYAPLFAFSLFFLLACAKGHALLGTIATLARRYYLPLCVMSFFISVDVKKRTITKFLYFVILFVILFGFLEYFAPIYFWDSVIALPKYWIDSGDRWAQSSIVTSGRFSSWDLTFLVGHYVRRMCSSFAEPTNFSSFCVSCFIIFRRHKIIQLLCFVCCCLAVSKAALMVFFGVIPVLTVYSRLFKNHERYDKLFLVMFLFLFGLSALMYAAGLSIGPFSHIAGFYTGVLNVLHGNIFGYGIGAVGNYSDVASRIQESIGSESGVGGMLGQCGLGAFFYFTFFLNLIRILQKGGEKNYQYIVLIFAWTVICIFSESAFGASGNILFFMYPAMAVRRALQKNQGNL